MKACGTAGTRIGGYTQTDP